LKFWQCLSRWHRLRPPNEHRHHRNLKTFQQQADPGLERLQLAGG
jgi:hypothetical protein